MYRTGADAFVSSGTMRPGRIVVIGTCGSGKTTLAHSLGVLLKVSHIELDSLYWDINWSAAPLPVFRARVAEALGSETWVIDGNYSKIRDLTWGCADMIVWLDYHLLVILSRLLRRTFSRVLSGKELWNDNRETWGNAVFGPDSIIVWMFKTYYLNKRRYSAAMKDPAYTHLQFVRLSSPQATSVWVTSLRKSIKETDEAEANFSDD